ncbi:MAG: PmoA family protein [Chitinophagaceae bacterium]|nr:PmoA family protein [Chitinophagaceae bacterium]
MKKYQLILAFQLVAVVAAGQKVEMVKNNGALTFRAGNKNLLSYQYQTVYPPAGIDTNYKRSGFIHPLYTPHGQVLTRIQPPDHYHHYGIWNPWTHTLFEKDTVDFWNIKGRQGTVRFAKFTGQTSNKKFAEYTALHEHVVFKKDGTEKIALNEWQTVRVYNPVGNKDSYIVDITSKMQCASQSPLLIVAYRYGGLGWRATEYWNKDNSEMLTSEGKTRDNTDNTKGKWIIVYGALPDNDEGGILMLSHPSNYNHPEPLRIWDKKQNGGRGDVFANFAPTKDKDWLLEPGKTYTLKYRLVVFNGKFDKERADKEWQSFAEVK